MRTITRSMAVGFGVLLVAGTAMPAGAVTMPTLTVPEQSDIIQVHDHGHNHNRIRGGHNNNHGFDGYYDDDYDSGVLFKSFVTGTLFNRQRTEGYYAGHAQACADRYQSYRASDNTYQPSHGPRRECR
ncbi:BA14K family protein [Rhizobium jaguaris]|uniref:Lectin-like protein BA14k n=1 Tax=Rhizobium jaguaris TaxID=1312183 RepID=A0A387FSL8_9HYPH|nr:BA14K family protein [Rhizobium jaguaris]AYG58721.1 BA14K family protein [Rhizobium jaguaris]